MPCKNHSECELIESQLDPQPEPLDDIGMCFKDSSRGGIKKQQQARTFKQRLQDVTTGVLVDKLFTQNKAGLESYGAEFVKCFNASLSATSIPPEECVLVYKGGNVLVDYFEQLLKLPGVHATPRLHSLLKRSDVDFSVVMFSNNASDGLEKFFALFENVREKIANEKNRSELLYRTTKCCGRSTLSCKT